MKKTKLGVLFVLALLVISVVSASMLIPRADKGKENANDKAPITPPGLEKVVFIHYKEGFAKPTKRFPFKVGISSFIKKSHGLHCESK